MESPEGDSMLELYIGDVSSKPWSFFQSHGVSNEDSMGGKINKARALLQMTAHSNYHRAQNATRLRELGSKPPLTDLIFWYWKGQPEAERISDQE